MNGTHGAIFGAFSAADALFVIHMCRVIGNLDCVAFTHLLAFHTADTADRAFFARKRALVVIFAKHRRFGFIQRDKFYELLRASCDTFFARLTLERVYARYAVANANGVIRAGVDTVAVA